MLRWALYFAVLAGVTGVYGFTGLGGVAAGIARTLAMLLGTLALVAGALALGRRRRSP